MFTPGQYRETASECGKLVNAAIGSNDRREIQELEQNFIALADNGAMACEQSQRGRSCRGADGSDGVVLEEDEERILLCLGAALVLQWNTLPRKLRRELLDKADSMGELLETVELRGKIAPFLHKHKDDEKDAT
ncbi:MAG TPA: hypothetical protein VHN11_11285 [Xanthobacteraceae bacterium]|jgi:hypothetical protein|nr:hypothetical protein [Xanthobacteraceae bacterium]